MTWSEHIRWTMAFEIGLMCCDIRAAPGKAVGARSAESRNIDPSQLVRVVFVWWCDVQNRLARRI